MPGQDGPDGEAPGGPEERLEAAQVAAPEAAAAVSPRPPRRPGAGGRAAVALALIGAALLLVLGFGLAARCRGGGPPAAGAADSAAAAAGAPGGDAVLAPIQARRDAGTGEEVAPFSGFALSIETDPPGALVTVGGVPRGEAPVLAGLDCTPGEPIAVRAERRGRRTARATVACRRDALVKLTLRLGK
ncbi:PEGA domain-containing protein [Anaeromyxobacter oryzae]|nr:PEGA domain-containing protein [Anaeromyxobacter oryzae]